MNILCFIIHTTFSQVVVSSLDPTAVKPGHMPFEIADLFVFINRSCFWDGWDSAKVADWIIAPIPVHKIS